MQGIVKQINGNKAILELDDTTLIEVFLGKENPEVGEVVSVFVKDNQYYIESEDTLEDYYNEGAEFFSQKTLKKGKGVVNKYIYVILAFTLGSFGIHKFYARKYFLGILYLIFSWTTVPGFIGVIEAIGALFLHEDSNNNIQV